MLQCCNAAMFRRAPTAYISGYFFCIRQRLSFVDWKCKVKVVFSSSSGSLKWSSSRSRVFLLCAVWCDWGLILSLFKSYPNCKSAQTEETEGGREVECFPIDWSIGLFIARSLLCKLKKDIQNVTSSQLLLSVINFTREDYSPFQWKFFYSAQCL